MTHARIYIIKIQALIRGYLLRKQLKIFSLLPNDVWDKVLYYIRYQNNIKHCFQKSINNVYNGKINNLKNKMRWMTINGSIYEANGEEIRLYRNYMYESDRLIYNRDYAIDLINTRRVIVS
jgi:hypothetical protein